MKGTKTMKFDVRNCSINLICPMYKDNIIVLVNLLDGKRTYKILKNNLLEIKLDT